jgi:hypothetical protein
MTKLNHDRPLLKYLDSVKRQIALDAQREKEGLVWKNPVRTSAPREEQIFPLTKEEASAVSRFFKAIEKLLEAEAMLLASLEKKTARGGKVADRKVAQDAAENQLARAAKAFAARMISSAVDGRMNLFNLYKAMEKALKGTPFLWDSINEVAMKSALQEIGQAMGVNLGSSSSKA